MRTLLLTVAIATSVAGCAGINRGGGASAGPVVSGEIRSSDAETGANTDSVATNGSNTTYPANGSPAR